MLHSGPAERAEPAVREPWLNRCVPHIARVYDHCLGGKNNFAADRAAAEEFARIMPSIVPAVRTSREFLARAVRTLTRELGIRQFLDIGTGLPSACNTHEVAQATAPDCRVVYVDNDPLVLAHARALLTSVPEGATAYVGADLRDTCPLISAARRTLDFSRPVALMMIGVLHCIPAEDNPYAAVGRLLAEVPDGSYLVLGHPASDVLPEATAEATARLNRRLASPVTFRARNEVARFLDGLTVLEPGLVHYPQWRPDEGTIRPDEAVPAWCAVARKG